jgi:hypothetical protein
MTLSDYVYLYCFSFFLAPEIVNKKKIKLKNYNHQLNVRYKKRLILNYEK